MEKIREEKGQDKKKAVKHRYDLIHMYRGEAYKTERDVSKERAQAAFKLGYDNGAEAVIIIQDGKALSLKQTMKLFLSGWKAQPVKGPIR